MLHHVNKDEISSYKQKDINFFAQELYKVNLIMWQAIHAADEFTNSSTINDFYNDEELMLRLAKAYKKVCDKKGDEGFADMELHSSYFQEFDSFTSQLSESLYSLEE